ncbi:hypothetical protein C1336_000780021 [Campylobacter jejuni subsp. jejuni 1336]|nr:hypothetical protein C1336_000780021 [Campylobacter jejuni subsp. jejuni 1336]
MFNSLQTSLIIFSFSSVMLILYFRLIFFSNNFFITFQK